MSKNDDIPPLWQLLLYSLGFPLIFIVPSFLYTKYKGEDITTEEIIIIIVGYIFWIIFFMGVTYEKKVKIIYNSFISSCKFNIDKYSPTKKEISNNNRNYMNSSYTLRTNLLFNLIGRSVIYCWFFVFVFGGFTLKIISHYSLEYLKKNNTSEDLLNGKNGLIDFMFWIKIHSDYLLYDYRWPAVIITSFIFMWFYASKTKIKFICPHCLKYVLFKNISHVYCSLCETPNHSRFELITFCGSCREKMEYIDCPHCSRTIEMSNSYNETSLMNKRKENAKLKPILLTGLRELYNRKKRLPQFICKHCLKTLITKNYNLTCPHCKAEYLVTDNRNQAQVGDVKIKNYRHIVDESTMEKVLFHSCIQCGGIIEAIRCYHEDCKKEINLREKYDEVELLRRRYEQENS